MKIILMLAILLNLTADPVGKTYKAQVNVTCKLMGDGGCTLFTYQLLSFKKDDVIVYYRVKAECTEKEKEKGYENMYNNLTKTYKWNKKGNVIVIEKFDTYGSLKLENSKLIGKDNIEFIIEEK